MTTTEKSASQVLEQLKDPKLLTAILASAGAAGATGGYLTSQGPQRRNETRGGRRMRILRNALLSAAAGGGAVGLGAMGYKSLNQALPANDVDPVTRAFTDPVGRALTGGLAYGGMGMGLDATWRKNKANEHLNKIKMEPQRDPIAQLKGVLSDPARSRAFRDVPGGNVNGVRADMGMPAVAGNRMRGGAVSKALRGVGSFVRPRGARLAAGAAGMFWPELLQAGGYVNDKLQSGSGAVSDAVAGR